MAITITTKRTTAEDNDPNRFPEGAPPFKACAKDRFPGQKEPVLYTEYGGTREEAAGVLLGTLGSLEEYPRLPADMRELDKVTLGIMAGDIPGIVVVHEN